MSAVRARSSSTLDEKLRPGLRGAAARRSWDGVPRERRGQNAFAGTVTDFLRPYPRRAPGRAGWCPAIVCKAWAVLVFPAGAGTVHKGSRAHRGDAAPPPRHSTQGGAAARRSQLRFSCERRCPNDLSVASPHRAVALDLASDACAVGNGRCPYWRIDGSAGTVPTTFSSRDPRGMLHHLFDDPYPGGAAARHSELETAGSAAVTIYPQTTEVTSVFWFWRRKARKKALNDALMRSVLLTSIVVPPPTATAADIRARADRGK